MIDQEKFDSLAPRAIQWAKAQVAVALKYGVPLAAPQVADAVRCGVREISQVRVLIVDRIPLPDDPELAEAARRSQIITEASRAIAIGYAIVIRADSWHNRELLLHQLVHVAQCERSGGLDSYLAEYLSDRRTSSDFSPGSFEDEARGLARQICAADEGECRPSS